jgi:hypothetical protein
MLRVSRLGQQKAEDGKNGDGGPVPATARGSGTRDG